jgi:molybdopterin molybdotransferase
MSGTQAQTGELAAPSEAMRRLCQRIVPVDAEAVPLETACGRVLAERVVADRASPACDVSAMDGYAIRLCDTVGEVQVAGEVTSGSEPRPLPPGHAMRIFTGGAVPRGAELVVPREQVDESPDRIVFRDPRRQASGANIRRVGENLRAGDVVVRAGDVVSPATVASLATFGIVRPAVHRRVRVGVIVTGNELLAVDTCPSPWQLRDSNGPALRAMLAVPWIELLPIEHAADDMEILCDRVGRLLAVADVLLLTGGVSMGDFDFVPAAVEAAGASVVFHKAAIRPGKPMLGAVTSDGCPILGLPGNPVSTLVTARRWASVALRRRAGFAEDDPAAPRVWTRGGGEQRLPLWWYRPVRLTEDGAEVVATRGSGDAPSLAASDGFIEVPPMECGDAPRSFFPWSLT